MLKRLVASFILITAIATLLAAPAAAQQRLIVRTEQGLNGPSVIRAACENVKCRVQATLDGNVNQLFVVSVDDTDVTTQQQSTGLLGGLLGTVVRLLSAVVNLLNQPGVDSVEIDQSLQLRDRRDSNDANTVPAALYDKTEVEYYGTTVRRGYVEQPAVGIVALDDTRRAYNVTGTGVVAVIDTGVDATHPVLAKVVLPGYDFLEESAGGGELGNDNQSTAAMVDRRGTSNQSTAAMVDEERPAFVNQSTAAMVDQSTAAMVDNDAFAAFGHGTMVAGVVHLVAPEAKILPLRAFHPDGSGYGSDVIRAIYYAAQNGANVINMSFSFTTSSPELERACRYAASRGIIMVASAGNDGRRTVVYPAGYSMVMGVASTNNRDYRSDFSNYGISLVWVAAPGEGIITTYPLGHYAATWGTSFSTPFVAGTAALLRSMKPLNEDQAATAVSNARWVSFEMGKGRLDVFRAVQYWRQIARIR